MPQALPRLYTDLAGWYLLLTAPEEYGEEAAFYWDCFASTATGPLSTLLERNCTRTATGRSGRRVRRGSVKLGARWSERRWVD